MFSRFRGPWISELYEHVQTAYLLPAIASVVVNPRRPKFNVTAKGVTIEDDVLSGLAWPYFVIFGVLAAGVVVTGLQVLRGWALYNSGNYEEARRLVREPLDSHTNRSPGTVACRRAFGGADTEVRRCWLRRERDAESRSCWCTGSVAIAHPGGRSSRRWRRRAR